MSLLLPHETEAIASAVQRHARSLSERVQRLERELADARSELAAFCDVRRGPRPRRQVRRYWRGRPVVSEETRQAIRAARLAGVPLREIAEAAGLSVSHAQRISTAQEKRR